MAGNNGFGVRLGFEFDSFDKVNKEYLQYIQKLSQSGQVKIGMDTKNLDSLKETFNQLSKTNIKVFESGAYSQIQTLKNSMGELLKITEQYNNQGIKTSTSYAISNSSKDLENQKSLYKELNNLQQTEYKLKQQMITADGNVYTELNRQLEVTRQMQSAVGRTINKSGLTSDEQTNSLLRQRIELTNSLKLAQAKNDDNQASKIAKEIEALKKEQEQVQQLIKNKIELLNIDKQRLIRQFGEKADTSSIDESISKLKSMNNVSLGTLKNEFRNIDTNIKQVTEDARANESMFSKIGSTLSNVGIYINLADVVRQLGQAFKDAKSYIEGMDKALTNIQMITGNSKSQVQETINQFKELGSQMHTTNSDMMKGAEENLRAGYSNEDSKYMMESAIIGSKISGQDIGTTTEQLIAIKNAFNMTGDSMQHVIDILSKADNTSATSFKEIADAIQRTAFSAQQAGTPLDNLVSYITTVSEKTRKSADTIGESFKTIYSRYSNIKLGNLDEDGKSINDTELAMKRIGIQIRDGKDKFREFDVVLKEFLDKYKSGQLSQVDFLAGAQALAGTRQRETLLALANNTDVLAQHQRDLADATGSAKKMFDEAYSDSLDAKINDLKRSFEGFYEKILSSDTLKTGITLLTKFIDTFGNIPSIIALASGALLVFKGQAIAGFITSLTQAITKTGLLKVAMAELDIAFSANPIGIATLAIGGLIGAFIALQPHVETTAEKIDGLDKSVNGLSKVQSNESLVNQYKELQKTINDTHTPVEKLTEAKKQLLEVQQQLAEQYPDLIDKIDDEGKHLVTNLDAVEEKINDDKDGAIKKAQQEYSKVFSSLTDKKEFTAPADVDNGVNPITTELPSEIEMYQKLYDKQSQWTEAENKRFEDTKKNLTDMNNAVLQIKKSGGDISEMKMFNFNTREMEDAKQRIKELEQASKEANDASKQGNNTPYEIVSEEKVSVISSALKELNSTSSLSEQAVKRLAQVLPSLDMSNMSATEKVDALTKALKDQNDELNKNANNDAKKGQKTFMEQEEGIDKINGYLKEMQKNGEMSADIMKELATSDLFSDFTGDLTNMASVQDYFNSKIENMRTIQNSAYQQLMGNSETYYKNQMHNGSALQSAYEQWASNYVNINETGYKYDSSNYNTLNQAKNGMLSNMSTVMSSYLANLVGGSADAYKKDLDAYKDWGTMKTEVLKKLDAQLANLNANFATGSQIMAQITKLEAVGLNDPAAEAILNKTKQIQSDIQAQIQKLMEDRKKIEADFNNINISDGQWNPPAKPVDTYKPVDYKGGSSGGSGKEAEKTISYITDETDALKDLKDTVDKVNDAIDQNQTLAENEQDQKKIELMKQQINLYNQLRDAKNNLKNGELGQLNSLKQSLIAQGFTFSGDDLVGSQGRLEELKNYFNKEMTTNNDNALKGQYDQIKKWVESYEKLVRDEIPSVTKDILDINNKILASQKEISEELQKVRDKFIKDKEAETETVKKELEKQRKIKEDEKNKEDKQDELGEKQKSLNTLQETYSNALKTGDTELIKQARKNIEDSQRELNKYLKDNNYQEEVDRISKEETYVDDESKSKIDNINKQLSDDNILKLVQQGVTNIDDMLRNVKASTADITAPVYDIGKIINNSWLTATEKMKNNLADASSILRSSLIGGNVGINQNMTVTAKDTKPVDININQTVNVQGDMTKDSLPDLKEALDDFKDEFEKFRDDVKDVTRV